MIQMDMKSNDFTHSELAERLSAIVESRLIYRVRKNEFTRYENAFLNT